ncbi:MAG: Qat anti-phage system TatD family nuclease QatD [Undibacterium sp.]|uniref:Qat anti-phage system TatD family nuclease QatD n=1 Tax=Undibacterium sp. TaxID=1914977 RepID=UPI00272741CB|nr:Qat anti-phage system TatD family nuclease QatD [Undibacterium sp.]MDO8653487.1 Qat anti-phage system TatD family nuclease QatD [Undibacterium sp.]
MDFHCHLDLYPNARQVYAETLKKNEFTWLVTTSPKAYEATSRILLPSERLVVSPGLHPEVADRKAEELDILLSQLQTVMAVGEVGLDGSAKYKESYALQHRIFTAVVSNCAALGGRILSVHSRAAANEVLNCFEMHSDFGLAVLHWFTDSPSILRRAASLGCWFSVGPAMLSSVNGRNLASLMPRDRVVPESDGPFGKIAGLALMPWDAANIAIALSALWKLPSDEVINMLRINGETLISLMSKNINGEV